MKYLILILLLLSSFSSFSKCHQVDQSFFMNDPIDNKPFEIKAKSYRPDLVANKKTSAIFILPPIVGETVLDRKMANRFCSIGFSAFILNVVKVIPLAEENANLNVHDDSYVRALAGVRAVIEGLKNDEHLTGEFGILGMSLGAMLSAYVAGSEPLIKASVIVVGAGNVPGVLAYSDQNLVAAQRAARLELFQLPDQNAYEAILKPLVPHDPLSVAQNIRPDSMYMFIALKDKTVPTKYQNELRRSIADPKVFEMNANHLGAIIKAGSLHAGKISNFFLNRLSH